MQAVEILPDGTQDNTYPTFLTSCLLLIYRCKESVLRHARYWPIKPDNFRLNPRSLFKSFYIPVDWFHINSNSHIISFTINWAKIYIALSWWPTVTRFNIKSVFPSIRIHIIKIRRFLYNRNSYPGNKTALYWNDPTVTCLIRYNAWNCCPK